MPRNPTKNSHLTEVRDLAPLAPESVYDNTQLLLDEGVLEWTDPDRTLADYRRLEITRLPIRLAARAAHALDPDDDADGVADSA